MAPVSQCWMRHWSGLPTWEHRLSSRPSIKHAAGWGLGSDDTLRAEADIEERSQKRTGHARTKRRRHQVGYCLRGRHFLTLFGHLKIWVQFWWCTVRNINIKAKIVPGDTFLGDSCYNAIVLWRDSVLVKTHVASHTQSGYTGFESRSWRFI